MIRRFIISLLTIVSLSPLLSLAPAAALPSIPVAASASKNAACASLTVLDSSEDCTHNQGTDGTIGSLVKTIVSVLSVIVGIAAIVMIIIGGFRYITSGGDSNSVSSAKSTIIYALIGLVIVALAQFIVHFVLTKVG